MMFKYTKILLMQTVNHETLLAFVHSNKHKRINVPVNAHLIYGPIISTKKIWIKMADQTLTLITHNPSFTHSVYYINQILGHRMQ